MKTPIITLACAALASFAFLACEDTGTNNPAPPVPPKTGCKVVADIVVDPPPPNDKYICDDYGTCKPEIPPDMPHYNPDTVLISPDVKEWMDEQLASGKSDRRDIYVSDTQSPTYATPRPTTECWANSSGEGGCIVNGVSMTLEEEFEYMDKWRRENPPIYRELDFPGEIIYEGYRSWGVPMTASEIEEFAQKYTALFIEFYKEAKFGNGVPVEPGMPAEQPGPGYNNDAPPPPIAGPADDTGGPRCP